MELEDKLFMSKINNPEEIIERLKEELSFERRARKRLTEKFVIAKNEGEQKVLETKESFLKKINNNSSYESMMNEREREFQKREIELERREMELEKREILFEKKMKEFNERNKIIEENRKSLNSTLNTLKNSIEVIKINKKDEQKIEEKIEPKIEPKIEEILEEKKLENLDIFEKIEEIQKEIQKPIDVQRTISFTDFKNIKISEIFEIFLNSTDIISVVETFLALKNFSGLENVHDGRELYPKLSSFIRKNIGFSKKSLFDILDKKFKNSEYSQSVNRKILIIGAGPSGLFFNLI